MTLFGLIKIAAIALDIVAISDVLAKHRDLGTRFVLIVMILVLPFIGAGLYLLVLRPKN